jgi:hypothetical protein
MMGAPIDDCGRCVQADRHASRYSAEEYEFITTKTGLILGTRDGLPIIAAVFILRSGIRHFACDRDCGPRQVHWDTPTLRCPWGRLALPEILSHGPNVFTPDGTALNGPMLDQHGHFRRYPHCPVRSETVEWPASEYYVRPEYCPAFTRRAV